MKHILPKERASVLSIDLSCGFQIAGWLSYCSGRCLLLRGSWSVVPPCLSQVLQDMVPPKKHLLRHQPANAQIGLMEGNTFCTTLQPRLFTMDLNVVEHKVFYTEVGAVWSRGVLHRGGGRVEGDEACLVARLWSGSIQRRPGP